MYARLVTFNFGTGSRSKVEALAGDLAPAIRAQKGCEGVTFFGDTDGEAGLFVLWETREDADAAAAVIGPILQKGLAGNIQAPPNIRLFEVIEA